MVTVRKAGDADVDFIYGFTCELEETIFDRDTFIKNFKQTVTDPNSIVIVAEIDRQAVGYSSCFSQVLLHHNGRVGEIQEVFVSAKHRGKAIGKLLVRAIEEHSQKQQWVGLEVCANIKRTDAHAFYTDLGFQQTHYKFTK